MRHPFAGGSGNAFLTRADYSQRGVAVQKRTTLSEPASVPHPVGSCLPECHASMVTGQPAWAINALLTSISGVGRLLIQPVDRLFT